MGGTFVEDKYGRQFVEYKNGKRYAVSGFVGETRVGYMCSTDFNHEVGEHIIVRSTGDPEGNKFYDSLEELNKARQCTAQECGYTKVLLVALEIGKPNSVDVPCTDPQISPENND